jgi:hypothetical protein
VAAASPTKGKQVREGIDPGLGCFVLIRVTLMCGGCGFTNKGEASKGGRGHARPSDGGSS